MRRAGERRGHRARWRCARRLAAAALFGTTCAALLSGLAPGPAYADLPYKAEIVGSDDKALVAEIKAVSQLVTLEEKPPESEAGLRRRAEEDLPRLKRVLESQGYWEGTVGYALNADAKPASITVKLDPGPLYRLAEVRLMTPEDGAPAELAGVDPATFGLAIGDPAKSAPVLDAEAKIIDALARRAHPFAKVTDRKAVVDRATKTMAVTYTVVPGPPAKFGAAAIEGLKRLDRDYVVRRIAWREGTDYDQAAVDATRRTLTDSGLFSAVTISHAEEPDAAGAVAMRIALVERLPRSLGVGLSYNTSQGFGANAFWEHRNLFGGGERLRLDADIAQQRRDVRANLRSPDLFGDKDRDFTALAEFADENPVAYTARRELAAPGVEQRFAGVYTAGVALQAQHARVTEVERNITQTYSIIGLPGFLRRDTRDDLLNPLFGTRTSLSLSPNTNLTGQHLQFLNSRLEWAGYQRIGESDRYVLAGFVGLGSIVGASRDALPADQRLYAGGGGSLRGYGYQLAGPLGPGLKPLGGRSLLQFGGELRIKISETIGIVPFLEAGNVFTASYPNFSGALLYDTGIGLRYYTPVGPLRLDLATPLRRRTGDAPIQIYISIGQAF